MSELFESQLRAALERRAAVVPDEAYERLREINYHPRSPAPRVALGVVAMATLATIVGISLALIGFGGGLQGAFAGWTPDPTAPRPGQIATAEEACERQVVKSLVPSIWLFRKMRLQEERRGLRSIHPLPGVGGPWRTLLADTRGPYTFVMLTNGEYDVHCLVGPGRSQLKSWTAGRPSASRVSVRADRIGALALGLTRAANGKPFGYISGRAGRGVRAVRIILTDGRRISATVAHGWYLGWWPGTKPASVIEVVSRRGTRSQRPES
ncbi:MAG TPA: hypothetical protein VG147_11265 [Solirubrobacteraceae bacterium]|jgi:hypothetical protein|nr:hypothetical protein [Solirubrobacteraceae bacterium]